jgi:hypothetical protein
MVSLANEIVRAAGLDAFAVDNHMKVILVGRALLPRGFYSLQTDPTNLPAYAAARAVHAAFTARQHASVNDIYKLFYAFVARSHFMMPDKTDKMRRVLRRAGVADERTLNASVCTTLFCRDTAAVFDTLITWPTYPTMKAVVVAEASHAKLACWNE